MKGLIEMKKEKYTLAEMEIIWFDVEDVIMTSGGDGEETGDDIGDKPYVDPDEL